MVEFAVGFGVAVAANLLANRLPTLPRLLVSVGTGVLVGLAVRFFA